MDETRAVPPEAGKPIIMVCYPVWKTAPQGIIHGSVQRSCTRCSVAVWLSPTSVALERQRTHEIVCHECAARIVEESGGATMNPLTIAQRAEIAAHYGRS